MGSSLNGSLAGIDLAGSQQRPTGLAILGIKGGSGPRLLFLGVVHSNNEVLELVERYRVKYASIDAPLSPSMRGYRKVDLVLIRSGLRVLPPSFPGMRALTQRALEIKKSLEARGVIIIETHPRSSLKLSGCRDLDELLDRHNISVGRRIRKDEGDALVCALTAYYYVFGNVVMFKEVDGEIALLPPICSHNVPKRGSPPL